MSPLVGSPQQYTTLVRELRTGTLVLNVDIRQCEDLYHQRYPYRIWAVAHLQAPDSRGLPMEAESEMLQNALLELTESMPDDDTVYFLGTMTHAGSYVAVFHAKEERLLADSNAATIPGSRYEWYVYTEEDPSYEFLKLKLVPTPQEKRRLQDAEVINALQDANDNSIVPRPITFYGLFRTFEDAQSASHDLNQQGYRTSPPSEMPGSAEFKWSLNFTRTSATDLQSIDEVSATAHDICITYGGNYDSWSCEPVEG